MYAVREEVEVLKEHIKELYERNSVLERENAVLKSLANSEQLGKLSTQLLHSSSSSSPTLQQQQQRQQPPIFTPLSQPEGGQTIRHQPNITSAWFAPQQDVLKHVDSSGMSWNHRRNTQQRLSTAQSPLAWRKPSTGGMRRALENYYFFLHERRTMPEAPSQSLTFVICCNNSLCCFLRATTQKSS